MTDSIERSVHTELVAVLVAVTHGEPRVLTTDDASALPAGPFELSHRSLQAGLRAWVETQTHHPLGYVEQLYTFADGDRSDESGARVMSVSYLGLTREAGETGVAQVGWQDWYRYFPWEDRRTGTPALVDELIVPRLAQWCAASDDADVRTRRQQRIAITFGLDGAAWNEDMVLQRYELLFEAGLVPEAARRGDGNFAAAIPGQAMRHDHRRILATGIARLRAKIKYRPVVFELMPAQFTLLQLQMAVEALAGRALHKQNFRRLIEQQALVEETGEMATGTAGRPAKLFRFRRDVLLERAIAGSKLPLSRAL
ncbi:NUDIX hydrolase [Achromobacter sp. ESBL13]|uniref:NUDIX hydrolase n=1 Tax=Achromobacter sp. ESBL13 TaxID=3077328 RepID=UPI002FCB5430